MGRTGWPREWSQGTREHANARFAVVSMLLQYSNTPVTATAAPLELPQHTGAVDQLSVPKRLVERHLKKPGDQIVGAGHIVAEQ